MGTHDSFRISNLLICEVSVSFSNPSLSANSQSHGFSREPDVLKNPSFSGFFFPT